MGELMQLIGGAERGLRQVGFRTRVWDVSLHRGSRGATGEEAGVGRADAFCCWVCGAQVVRTEEVEMDYWSKDAGRMKEVVRLERFDTEKGGRVPDVFALGRFLG